ncbi:DUF3592 domain-containing protein [uncultured Ruegeria sp.]|uniref:DUF3592 domain-containing protein n=1 Tax=uncultured Ruegeria sp. TaxID=259304 RepID=UPI00262830CB|nr:DUF3592 domain-containing protein [uncultured Ruegeria sp.]
MSILARFWKLVRVTFLEGMLHRTEDGRRLGFFSRRGWGANLMFAGITGCVIGLVWIAQRAHFELDALTAASEVLEVQQGETSDGDAVYQLTLRWTHEDGTTYVTIPRVRASYYNLPVGTELDIKYDPNDPKDVRVETQEGPWFFPRLILISSLMSFVMGRLLRGNPEA